MIYSCPQCRTQNFFPTARKKNQNKAPLRCWKCGIMIKTKIKNKKKDLTLKLGSVAISRFGKRKREK